jgi:hypothetical protein
MTRLSRRDALKRGLLGAAGVAAAGPLGRVAAAGEAAQAPMAHATDPHAVMTGGVPAGAGIDPLAFLTDFDYGTVGRRADGRTVRDFQIVASDRNLEVMPGVFYPAWTYNGQVPGPRSAPPRVTWYASGSSMAALTRTPSTSTACTPRTWTACSR